MGSLKDRVERLRREVPEGGKFFISDRDLEETVSETAIEEVLSSKKFAPKFYKRREIIQLISKGGRKTLAILVLLGIEEAILKFVENDHLKPLDPQLPLKKETITLILGDIKEAKDFYQLQWEFLAPFLHKDRSHRKFEHTETIQPFLTRELINSDGGFGDIFKVTLHPSHQRLVELDASGKAIVAQKVIRSTRHLGNENEEERILASLRSLRHQNIIALLTSYSIGPVHNLIFPLAQGNLETLLCSPKDALPPNLRHPHAILRQTYGLSSALEMVHNFFVGDYDLNMIGCHHDLSPKNVLIKDGKFLLADFGLSRLDDAEGWAERELKRLHGPYNAPECESLREGFIKKAVGTPSDVWSFGCIFAEIVTFLLRGPEGIQDFRMKRKTKVHIPSWKVDHTVYYFHSDGEPNHGVEQWLAELEREAQSVHLGRLPRMVREILILDPLQRPTMEQASDALFFLAQKALFGYSCERVDELLRESKGRDPSGGSLNVDLMIQRNRYKIWGGTAGLNKEFSSIRATRHTAILQVRGQCAQISDTLREIEDEIHFLHSWKERSPGPTYFQFNSLNDKLQSFLPSKQVSQNESILQSTMLDDKSPEELFNISDTLDNNASEYAYLAPLAKIRAIASDDDGSYAGNKDLNLKQSDISPQATEFGMHQLGLLNGPSPCPVLIERMPYTPDDESVFSVRVRKISRLFSTQIDAERSGLRVLRCKGYYQGGKSSQEDKTGQKDKNIQEKMRWYNLVYELPTNVPTPVTLRQIIERKAHRDSRPNLGDVFSLATKIVRCVLEIHKVGWMHKGISSQNIIFLGDVKSSAAFAACFRSPYLIGFNHSREDTWQAFTEGLDREMAVDLVRYQHPHYLNKQHGYKPEYDFYSLGVVLLEIGRWRPIKEILESSKKTVTKDNIKGNLIKECERNLGNSMGVLYRDAVAACLASDFVLKRGGEEMRNDFEEKVLNRLAECRA